VIAVSWRCKFIDLLYFVLFSRAIYSLGYRAARSACLAYYDVNVTCLFKLIIFRDVPINIDIKKTRVCAAVADGQVWTAQRNQRRVLAAIVIGHFFYKIYIYIYIYIPTRYAQVHN